MILIRFYAGLSSGLVLDDLGPLQVDNDRRIRDENVHRQPLCHQQSESRVVPAM